MSSETALYRHFDQDGALLYVGISLRPTYRLSQHDKQAHWSARIATVTVERFPSRELALEAESRAIATEHPRHNILRPKPEAVADGSATAPRHHVPQYVYRPEAVAAHFGVSMGFLYELIRLGMPRERLKNQRYRYDLEACRQWLASEDTKRRDAAGAAAAERAKQADAQMRDALMRAFGGGAEAAPC